MRSLAISLAAAASLAVAGLSQEASAITLANCTSMGGSAAFGNCYIGNAHEMTWAAHEAAAQSLGHGFHLASIHSAAENAFIWNFFGSSMHEEDWGRFIWIGLSDFAAEGHFKWSDGSPLNYTNWYPDQPDNAGNEDYVHLGFYGLWNDFPEDTHLKAVYSTALHTDPVHAPPPPPPPPSSSIPEPTTLALFGLGLAGIGFARRRKTA